jgi:glycosyltransferase involved in cell wall biosynthesis
MKEIADYIIVSTPALAATFSDVKDKVLVAPNLLDLSMYPEVASEEFTDSDGKKGKYYDIKVHTPVRVVWVGSETHRGDVDEITEGLDEFLAKYCGLQNGNKAVVIFSGMLPHGNIVRKYLHKGLLHQPMVPFVSYHQVLTSIQPHVYLAPLASIPFNQAKSNLRVIEGMALCAPSVASSWGEYETTIKDGVDGVLSYTPDSFYSKLVEVVTDPEYRVSLASHGRMKVETQYNWAEKKCRQAWYNVFDKILGYTG